MKRLNSQRLFALMLLAVGLLTMAAPARAAERAYSSHGTAQFTSPTEFVGTGNATHLGLYSEEGSVDFTPTDNPAVLHLEAESTYTAANGDQLHATFSGELNGLTGVITATVTYAGGTGRFAKATGTANFSGQLFPGGSIEVAIKGTIKY